MDDRPLKIKKSHMEPDMRSLIPEVQLNLNVSHPLPPIHKAPKPPRMQANPSNLDILMGLPSAPGLIPSNFVLPPPPPLIKMPTQSPTLQVIKNNLFKISIFDKSSLSINRWPLQFKLHQPPLLPQQ